MIRRIFLAALCALFLPATAPARDSAESKPLIVLLEANPWLMAIGSDSPSFALYDDGTAIYATDTGYKSIKLDATERDALIASVKPEVLAKLAGHYDIAEGVSDQRTNYFFVYGSGAPKVISVYGPLGNKGARAQLLAPIPAAYDVLHSFRHPNARDWLPDKIEVMIWPYEHSIDASIEWPGNWPGLKDPTTVKRGTEGYSLYLPSAEYPALIAFLKTQKERGAILIAGHKWSASIRFPFPQEGSWMSLRGYEPD
jgi:hypothetical protein